MQSQRRTIARRVRDRFVPAAFSARKFLRSVNEKSSNPQSHLRRNSNIASNTCDRTLPLPSCQAVKAYE